MSLRTGTALALGLCLLIGAASAAELEDNPWSRVDAPRGGAPEVVGGYAAGCLAGAEALPAEGAGYRVMRTRRHRYFGHPALIRFVRTLAGEAQRRGLGPVLVGDLAQPRGGPMPSGHASHQSGLDVDIWLRPAPAGMETQAGDGLELRSVVRLDEGRLDPRYWTARERDLLRLAASQPGVERIFVNPVIKRSLCAAETDRGWLRRLRPWWGHDAHFHVRLACPPDSPRCRAQAPPPPGDGCDEDLDGWVRTLQRAAANPPEARPQRPLPELPGACAAVLAGPAAPPPLAVRWAD